MLLQLLSLAVGTIFIENMVLVKFLGICPFLGVSKQTQTALGMGMAVTFVMTIASIVTYFVQKYLLLPFELTYLQTLAFILVIAALVQFVEMFLQKASPALYNALGIYLPLITTNCAVLGVAILNVQEEFNFVFTMVNGFAGGLSFTLAIFLLSGVRERLSTSAIPKAFQGFPSVLIAAALISLAFLGFSGLNLPF